MTTHSLYLNGVIFDGTTNTVDFTNYADIVFTHHPHTINSLTNKLYVDNAVAAVPAGPTGATGLQGPTGFTGPPTPAGVAGVGGADGATGATGATGPVGPAGPAGVAGPEGPVGATGPVGPAGVNGADGAAGPPGVNGADGAAGMNGVDGATGPTGASGADILGLENTFSETTTFSKQLVLPESLTDVSITNHYSDLNVDCAHASSGIFILNIYGGMFPYSPTINNLNILNPRIGGQYVVYIHNHSSLSFSINGRTTYPPLYVNMSSSNGSSSSSSTNIGRMNYPGAVMITGNTELSSAILSFTWDGAYAFVACSAYGISAIMGET
jgi:hypothetical protein